MDSWFLKLLPRDIGTKTKNKDQPTKNHKKIEKQNTTKKIKVMGNITPTITQCPRNG